LEDIPSVKNQLLYLCYNNGYNILQNLSSPKFKLSKSQSQTLEPQALQRKFIALQHVQPQPLGSAANVEQKWGIPWAKPKRMMFFLPTKIGIEWDLNDLTTEGWILATHS